MITHHHDRVRHGWSRARRHVVLAALVVLATLIVVDNFVVVEVRLLGGRAAMRLGWLILGAGLAGFGAGRWSANRGVA
ncbi:MAG: hypothetical protein OEU32_00625 [Acidimicrobiia bacterium]|nr:hypothetical protein [Acidimicrobiia bacterium]